MAKITLGVNVCPARRGVKAKRPPRATIPPVTVRRLDLLSVILPIHNEEENLPELIARIQGSLSTRFSRYELVCINDGSDDGTLSLLLAFQEQDPRIVILDLTRNFGHQAALTAGLEHARGNVCILMDSDLQDPPDLLPELLTAWEGGAEIVYARRRSRRDSLPKRWTAAVFYRLLKMLSATPVILDAGDFCLVSRPVVRDLLRCGEHHRFLRGLLAWTGHPSTTIWYDRAERRAGHASYTLRRSLRLALDAITGFSAIPLKIASVLGCACAAFGFLYLIVVIIQKIVFPETVVIGWASVIVAIVFFGGIQLLFLGIIGEYLSRVYTEAQRRPLYLLRQRYTREEQSTDESSTAESRLRS